MKNQFFLLFAFVFTGLFVSNASTIIINSEKKTELKVIENTYTVLRLENTVSGLSLKEVNTKNGIYVKAEIAGYGVSLSVGDPELPVLNGLIEIPYAATVETEIIRSSYKDYDLSALGFSGTIIPSHGPISKDIYNQKPIEYFENAQTYSSNSFIGQENVSIEILGTMRGVRIGRLKIAPVQYNPTTRTIRVFDELVINHTY